jgi:nicotinate-nucleotide adenylyltransferase
VRYENMTEEYELVILFGGTFDPVHNGHLRLAHHVQQQTQGAGLHFVPCWKPPHRDAIASPGQRMTMLKIAIEHINNQQQRTCFEVGDYEHVRPGISWTWETVRMMRQRVGRNQCLCLLMGLDSYEEFNTWRNWREILDETHLIVHAREGASADLGNQRLQASLASNCQDLRKQRAGLVWHVASPLCPESSTVIRNKMADASLPEGWLPERVEQYIKCEHLYGLSSNE